MSSTCFMRELHKMRGRLFGVLDKGQEIQRVERRKHFLYFFQFLPSSFNLLYAFRAVPIFLFSFYLCNIFFIVFFLSFFSLLIIFFKNIYFSFAIMVLNHMPKNILVEIFLLTINTNTIRKCVLIHFRFH